ncbi:MAG TPA: VOC family protein [Sulfuricurvum sp.]|nr:VOC family protein [Sulfuricurvum sp.]
MSEHEKIDYIEFPSCDLMATKAFFNECFGWKFKDYGPDYTAFFDAGLMGGFFHSDTASKTQNGAALVVLYSETLEATEKKIKRTGGVVTRPIFSFPGGRRFHFTEPGGNELAVWSEK